MIVLDNGDALRGDASAATVVDYTINGVVGTAATQLADGQLAVAEGNLYLSAADGIVILSITLVNTDASARTVNLYLKPSAGTSRRIIPKNMSLSTGYSLHTDGVKVYVMSTTGQIVQTYSLHATYHQDAGADEISVTGLSGLLADDQHVLDAEALAAIPAASTTVVGKIEIAIASEVDTGSDATRAVSPDSLGGSIFGEKLVYLKVITEATALTTGDGKMYFTVPDSLNGMNLVDADAAVYTVSSSGTPTVQINNATDTHDMLSTLITIDANETTSYTAATPPVIDTNEDDVVTGDQLRIDVDVAGTGTKGLDVILTFQLP